MRLKAKGPELSGPLLFLLFQISRLGMVNRQMHVYATNRVEGQKGLTEFFAAMAFEARGKETLKEAVKLQQANPAPVPGHAANRRRRSPHVSQCVSQ